jgi:hypothetical protein
MSTEPARPSDDAIVVAAAQALRTVVLPNVVGAHARATVIHLIGLLRYLGDRGPDREDLRRAQLIAGLDRLADNPIVAPLLPGEPFHVAAAALAAAVSRDDAPASAVRDVLRPILVAHLDDELGETTPLISAFRGQIVDGR